MTIGTAALIQSLRLSAKPDGQMLGSDADGQNPGNMIDPETKFLDFMKSLTGTKSQMQSATGDSSLNQDRQPGQLGQAAAHGGFDSSTSVMETPDPNFGEPEVITGGGAGSGPNATVKGAESDPLQSVLHRMFEPVGETVASPAPNSAVHAAVAGSLGVNGTVQAPGTALPPSVAPASAGHQVPAARTSGLFAQFTVDPHAVDADGGSGEQSLKPKIDIGTVKVLRQETHFAPTLRLSPVQQIGDGIVAALKELPGNPSRGLSPFSVKSEGPVLKTLEIQLQPIELGVVKVSLKMVGDQVEVTLKASNPQTVELLRQDRHLLDQMLRATGHKADAIIVQAADDRPASQIQAASTSQNNASGQSNDSFGGQGATGSAAQDGRGGRGGEPGPDQTRTPALIEDENRSMSHETETQNRSDGGLYL